MKKFRSFVMSLSVVALSTGIAINFNACSEQSPVSSEPHHAEPVTGSAISAEAVLEDGPLSEEQLNAITAPEEKIQVAEHDLRILKSKSGFTLMKRFVASWYVPLGASGWAYAGDDEHGRCWLYFPLYAMDQSTIVTIDWESKGFLEGGAEFSPDGVQFNSPVTVWVSYKDADLGGIAEEDLRLWYFNEDTQKWEVIGDVVDIENQMVGGLLHHFSRYAIGTE